MIVNLDDAPLDGQTLWKIYYFNDENQPNQQILPKAKTEGLVTINKYELIIRLVPPNKAAPILDQVGLWISKNRPTEDGDVFIIFEESYTIKTEANVQRLSWSKDT
jgi:hypothetical protein